MPHLLALDLGTSKLAALLLDIDTLEIAASARIETGADLENSVDGRHEQDPLKMEQEVFQLSQDLLQKAQLNPDQILGIAIAGQMHGVMLVDPATYPLTPFISWRDQRSKPVIDGLRRGEWPVRVTGCPLRVGYGGATLSFLARDVPFPIYARAVSLADFMVARWSGWIGTEPCHAASWGMLDIHTLHWHEQSVKRLRLPSSVLPRIVPSLSPVGHLKRDAASSLGLSTRTRVFAPIGDHQATCWAAGPARSDGLIFNLGTGGQVSWYTRRSEVINGLETRPMPGGGYIAVGASINGGWAYQYLAELFRDVVKQLGFGNPSTQEVFDRMLQLHGREAAARPRVDPSFSGTRIAPDATGSITDISRENLTPANLAAAFSAGMVHELVSMIPKPILRRVSVVTAGGSGFRENPWAAQELQDQFQECPIEILPETRDASLGAGLATISLSREVMLDAG